MSTFWEIFLACLTGAGAMTLAIGVIALAVWSLVNVGGFLGAWIADAFENRGRS